MKKSLNKIAFISALLVAAAFLLGYAINKYKNVMDEVVCSQSIKQTEEKSFQADIPFLESLTRRFLILYH